MMSATQIDAPAGMPFIDITREFDAPRDLVYRAYTDPDLLVQWLGPRKYKMTIESWDVRDGGKWRYIHSDDEGNAWGFHGVFHGEQTPDGMLQTFEFEGCARPRVAREARASRSATARRSSATTPSTSRSRPATR